MISAGADGTTKMPASLLNASFLNGCPAGTSNFGNHLRASACPANSPDKSTIRAPLFLARSKFLLLNAGEPVKNTIQALLKLSSSTGWIIAASPPASVSIPAKVSSSTRRKSDAAKRLSSRSAFSSAPSREEAPAMTILRDSRGVATDQDEAEREA